MNENNDILLAIRTLSYQGGKIVITSYSIHYTKLYEGNHGVIGKTYNTPTKVEALA